MRRFVLLVLLLLAPPAMAAEPRVEYVVHLDRPQTQTLRVELILRDVERGVVELVMPTWRPGRYFIHDPSGTVRWFRATDGSGEPLGWEKVRKNHWRVTTGGAGEVRAEYELYANSINDRTRHVDETHAFLSGSSVFLFDPERRAESATVRIEAPDGWRVGTGLEPAGDDPRVLLAPDYDILVDSPIEVGEQEVIGFDVLGVPHEIVIWGEWRWEGDRLVEDFSKIVEEQAAIFGGLPYERYVFLVHVGDGLGGGTEHYNSTIMQTRPSSFESADRYEGFLGLVSHEFFHTWNVKRLRPAGINPYDYDRENYTKLLWVAEGTTSYYDDLTLVRTGQIDVGEYLDRVGGSMSSLSRQVGRHAQSLEESSFDAWVKFTKRTPDYGNIGISFYQKGALVSLLLDLELRRRTGGEATLDDVMRSLFERFPLEGPGFTPEDLISVVEELSGSDFGAFFEGYVAGTAELDYADVLDMVGLELTFKPNADPWVPAIESDDDEEGDDDAQGGDEYRERPALGLSLNGSGIVRSVREDGPAFGAGIIEGDELLAIDGERVAGSDARGPLRDAEPGDEVTLLIARRGRVFERTVTLGAEPDGKWVLSKIDEPTGEQEEAFEAWLHQPWSGDDEDDASAEADAADGDDAD